MLLRNNKCRKYFKEGEIRMQTEFTTHIILLVLCIIAWFFFVLRKKLPVVLLLTIGIFFLIGEVKDIKEHMEKAERSSIQSVTYDQDKNQPGSLGQGEKKNNTDFESPELEIALPEVEVEIHDIDLLPRYRYYDKGK